MKEKLNKKSSYIIIFLILCILLIVNLYIIIDYKNNFNKYLEYKENIFQNSISEIFHTYEEFSSFIYETEVNTEEVKKLFYDASKAEPKEQDILRTELYNQFEDMYQLMTQYNFRQFHFHFPNGDSFLRVHYPERYGDNLFSIRESIRIANEEEHFVSGFEEGRIYNGYRYVYPLNYQGKHIGSVEVSISVSSVLKELYTYNEGRDIGFMIRKDVVEEMVFEETKCNYRVSYISDDYYSDVEALKMLDESEHTLKIYKDEKFMGKLKENVADKLSTGESFSVAIKHEDLYYLVQLCAIENVAGDSVGYFVSIAPDEQILSMKKNNIRWILFSFFIMITTVGMAIVLIRKQLEVQMLAMEDPLTKIYNRRFFYEIAEKEIRKTNRDQTSICLAMMDIDNFKHVNDAHGHLVGDAVLKSFANIVQESIRVGDVFARYGGEEFILLMTQTTISEAEIILERIRKEIENFDFAPVEKITISIGFVKVDAEKKLEINIDKADEALYIAKEMGRNKVIEYKENLEVVEKN